MIWHPCSFVNIGRPPPRVLVVQREGARELLLYILLHTLPKVLSVRGWKIRYNNDDSFFLVHYLLGGWLGFFLVVNAGRLVRLDGWMGGF